MCIETQNCIFANALFENRYFIRFLINQEMHNMRQKLANSVAAELARMGRLLDMQHSQRNILHNYAGNATAPV